MLKIWGRLSSINVRKVVWTAQALGLPFERADAGLTFGIVKTPDYLRHNPNALVPLIEDDDQQRRAAPSSEGPLGGQRGHASAERGGSSSFLLWESNVIVRYLCAKHSPGNLYPDDLQARFDAERWMDWQQTTINPAGRNAFIQWFRTPAEQRNLAVIADSTAAMEPMLALLDAHLAHQAFMAGGHMTMADIPLVCEIHRWWGLPQPRKPWPHLDRWYQGLLVHPASRGVLDIGLA